MGARKIDACKVHNFLGEEASKSHEALSMSKELWSKHAEKNSFLSDTMQAKIRTGRNVEACQESLFNH